MSDSPTPPPREEGQVDMNVSGLFELFKVMAIVMSSLFAFGVVYHFTFGRAGRCKGPCERHITRHFARWRPYAERGGHSPQAEAEPPSTPPTPHTTPADPSSPSNGSPSDWPWRGPSVAARWGEQRTHGGAARPRPQRLTLLHVSAPSAAAPTPAVLPRGHLTITLATSMNTVADLSAAIFSQAQRELPTDDMWRGEGFIEIVRLDSATMNTRHVFNPMDGIETVWEEGSRIGWWYMREGQQGPAYRVPAQAPPSAQPVMTPMWDPPAPHPPPARHSPDLHAPSSNPHFNPPSHGERPFHGIFPPSDPPSHEPPRMYGGRAHDGDDYGANLPAAGPTGVGMGRPAGEGPWGGDSGQDTHERMAQLQAEIEQLRQMNIQRQQDSKEAEKGEGVWWEEQMCVVCLASAPECVFIPCGHLVACSQCAQAIKAKVDLANSLGQPLFQADGSLRDENSTPNTAKVLCPVCRTESAIHRVFSP